MDIGVNAVLLALAVFVAWAGSDRTRLPDAPGKLSP